VDTHQEQIDVEGGDGREGQSGEDANTDVEESEDVDGQDLDGDNDLGIQVNEDRDGGLGSDGSLYRTIAGEFLLD